MRIGIDFDNTIVSYDALFHRVALERAHIPADLPVSKLQVRDYLRSIDREPVWTELQGYVYGARMAEADMFPGVLAFLNWARGQGHETFIISHKTLHPFMGPPYNLHDAAREWVAARLCDKDGPLVAHDRIHFEVTKSAKLDRIATNQCDVFIDDLPEILLATGFPPGTRPILFDPDGAHGQPVETVVRHWDAIPPLLAPRC